MAPLAQPSRGSIATAARRASHGGWAAMRRVIDGNAAGFADEGAGILEPRSLRQADAIAPV